MNTWATYKQTILRNCLTQENEKIMGLPYWRNMLLANTIIYLLPLCLIALLPGVYYSIKTGLYSVAAFDLIVLFCILYIAFSPSLQIGTRKIIFVSAIYLLAFVLLLEVAQPGPGLIYMYAACVFSILILPGKYALLWGYLNTAMCIIKGFFIYYNISFHPLVNGPSLAEWIAVSTNLVFLSFISVMLIPKLFNGLHDTIETQKKLKEDLTEKQRSLEETLQLLKQKNEDLEHFTYMVSHDLQEPLRMVDGFITKIDEKYSSVLDEQGKTYIHFAVDGAKRMQSIIRDLLEFSRLGREAVTGEMIDINDILEETTILLRTAIDETGASITWHGMPVIYTQKTALRQLLQNLISNALKYHRTDTKHLVNLVYEEQETHHEFAVTDNGIGISNEHFDKIFVIFQRLHHNKEYSGTGLGLAICKKITDNLGGKIWVTSEKGEGSTFYFTIPKNFNIQNPKP